MAGKFFKWFFAIAFLGICCSAVNHPIFVSVTEIEHNVKENSLEISCKLFTDDFENALRNTYHAKVDLVHPRDKAGMEKLVNDYIQSHLKIKVDGKLMALKFLGYEQVEEGIYSYFEAKGVEKMKTVTIFNNLLYEYKPEQMGLVHVIQKGVRKSTKMMNPTDNATIIF
jgi:hypothetical protein